MTFLHLLDGAEVLSQSGDAEISGVEYDSRRVQPGDCFVAMRGESTDGNRFIDGAIAQGAVAVVTDSAQRAATPGSGLGAGRYMDVARWRASARISIIVRQRSCAHRRHRNQWQDDYQLPDRIHLAAAGRKSALVGTIEYHVAGKVLPAPHTTPEALELERGLRRKQFARARPRRNGSLVARAGARARFRNSLRRGRVHQPHARPPGFSPDHGRLLRLPSVVCFDGCGTETPRVSVINIEDEYGARLERDEQVGAAEDYVRHRPRRLSRRERGHPAATAHASTWLRRRKQSSRLSPLLGRVNVYNVLAAAAAAYGREDAPRRQIARGIVAALARVPGRFERVDCGQPFQVVVDYAHTDAALRNVTVLARSLVGDQWPGDHRLRVRW